MDRTEWLEARRGFIGGSEAAALLGAHPYKTPTDVYLAKVEPVESEAPDLAQDRERRMALGLALEPFLARFTEDVMGVRIRRNSNVILHPEFAHIGGTPDAHVIGSGEPVSFKVVGRRQAWRWDDGVPEEVQVQERHYLGIERARGKNVDRTHVAVLCGTDFELFEVRHDDEAFMADVEASERFWREHVEPRIPPPADASEAFEKYAKVRAKLDGVIVEAGTDAAEVLEAYFNAKTQAKAAEEIAKLRLQEVMALVGEHQGVKVPGYVAKWTERKGSPSWKSIAEELGASPDLVERHRGAPSRSLTVKAVKA